MPQTLRLNLAPIGGLIQTQFSGNVLVGADGTAVVDSRDVPTLLGAGATFINAMSRFQPISAARAGTAARIVASAALSNGTFAIANQPDVPRVLAVRVDPGTSAITAGNVVIPYVANDGTTTTDTLALSTAASTVFTLNTSKGVMIVNSVTAAGLVGGASPKIEVTDTNFLAMAVDPGFQGFSVLKANVDGANETIGSVIASAGAISPTTAPNGTHTYGIGYSYNGIDS